MQYQNDLILRAAWGKPTERTPVWMMRQAGRVLPEYRAVRAQRKDFKDLLKSPEFATEVTIQPVDILGVDAAIIFSDILVIPEAMGLDYEMLELKGPNFPKTIESIKDIENLHISDGKEGLEYVLEAIKMTVKELDGRVPLIGFCGAPWTLFAYMVEGKGSKTFSKARKWLYTEPKASHVLLQKITTVCIGFLKAQIESGVALVQIFDSWAGILPPAHYNAFSLPYIQQIVQAIHEVPVTVFAKDAWFARKELAATGCQVLGLDWCMSIAETRNLVGQNITLQGNLDPCALFLSEALLEKEIITMLEQFGPNRHIANLGHGLYPDLAKDKAKFFVDTVKAYQHKS